MTCDNSQQPEKAQPSKAAHPAAGADSHIGQPETAKAEPVGLTLGQVTRQEHADAIKAFESKTCSTGLPGLDLMSPAGPLKTLQPKDFKLGNTPPEAGKFTPGGWTTTIEPALPNASLTDAQMKSVSDAKPTSDGARVYMDHSVNRVEAAQGPEKTQQLGAVRQVGQEALSRYSHLQPLKESVQNWLNSLPEPAKNDLQKYEGLKSSLDTKSAQLPELDRKYLGWMTDFNGGGVPPSWKAEHPDLINDASNLKAAKAALPATVIENLDMRGKLDSIQKSDVKTFIGAARAAFEAGNDRNGSREMVRQLSHVLSAEDQKLLSSPDAQRLTDQLGMTKGEPFKRVDPADVAQDIVNKAWPAMHGEEGTVQGLRDMLKSVPSEVLNKAAAILESRLGQGDWQKQGVTVHRDGQGDVTELTFHPELSRRVWNQDHAVKVTINPINNFNADHDFANRVGQEYQKLPVKIREMLASNNVRVVTADRVEDIAPGTDQRAIGVAMVKGDIVVAQKTSDKSAGKDDNPPETLRHEVGHKIDELLGQLTATPEFREAYRKDVQELFANDPNNERAKQFLKEPVDRSVEELAAESYAKLLGGSDDDALFSKHFTLSQRYLADKLAEYYKSH